MVDKVVPPGDERLYREWVSRLEALDERPVAKVADKQNVHVVNEQCGIDRADDPALRGFFQPRHCWLVDAFDKMLKVGICYLSLQELSFQEPRM